MNNMEPRTEMPRSVRDYLELITISIPDGCLFLAHLDPFSKKWTQRAYATSDIDGMMEFCDSHSSNVFISVASFDVAPGSTNGRDEGHVRCLVTCHGDLDPSETRSREVIRDEVLPRLTDANLIIDSGHGYQFYCRLDSPIENPTPEDIERVQQLNRSFVQRFGADVGAISATGMVRVPFIPNHPGADKAARKGYADEPVPTSVISFHYDHTIKLPSSAPPKPLAVPLTQRIPNMSGRLRELIKKGDVDNTYESRSEAMFAAVCALALATKDDDFIVRCIMNPEHEIGDKAREQGEGWLRGEIGRAREKTIPAWFDDLDARYFVAELGGKVLVFSKAETGKPPLSFTEFSHLYQNVTQINPWVPPRKGAKPKNIGQAFLDCPLRKTYQELVVDVSRSFGGFTDNDGQSKFNIYRGFTVQPQPNPEKTRRFKQHLQDIICQCDQPLFDWLWKFLARLIQHPDLPGEVCIVMRGRKGSGKTLVTDVLLKLFGAHGGVTSRIEDLTHWNGWTQGKMVIVLEEGFFAGNRADDSVLKQLITDRRRRIEYKGLNSVEIDNQVTLFINSNEDWVIPATNDERRFLVLDVADTMSSADQPSKQTYFEAIHDDLKDGGYEALLYELLHEDVSNFAHRYPPKTTGLKLQQEETLDPVLKTLFKMLRDGQFSNQLKDAWPDDKTEVVPRDVVHSEYKQYAPRPKAPQHLSHKFAKVFGKEFVQDPTPAWMKWDPVIDPRDGLVMRYRREGRTWGFPPLGVARKHFEKHMGWSHYDWGPIPSKHNNGYQIPAEDDDDEEPIS